MIDEAGAVVRGNRMVAGDWEGGFGFWLTGQPLRQEDGSPRLSPVSLGLLSGYGEQAIEGLKESGPFAFRV